MKGPNITGYIAGVRMGAVRTAFPLPTIQGAIQIGSNVADVAQFKIIALEDNSDFKVWTDATLNASWNNLVYGASLTVQPTAIAIQYLIRY